MEMHYLLTNQFITKEEFTMDTKLFTNEEMLQDLPEFSELYKFRPIEDNTGGMNSSHLFPSWYLMKKYSPKYIVESGVFKGQGTWFFEKASPMSKIISIEPRPHQIIYKSPNVEYILDDFSTYLWDNIDNKENTILFFDDHQNSIERLKCAGKLGFKKFVFEDNYPCLQGDCYSPKKVLSQQRYITDFYGDRIWADHKMEDYEYFVSNVKIYFEFPPIFKSNITRWGDEWNDINYPTKKPLLEEIDKDKYPLFYKESTGYTWICYVELK
jgi:hypothetical protein